MATGTQVHFPSFLVVSSVLIADRTSPRYNCPPPSHILTFWPLPAHFLAPGQISHLSGVFCISPCCSISPCYSPPIITPTAHDEPIITVSTLYDSYKYHESIHYCNTVIPALI